MDASEAKQVSSEAKNASIGHVLDKIKDAASEGHSEYDHYEHLNPYQVQSIKNKGYRCTQFGGAHGLHWAINW